MKLAILGSGSQGNSIFVEAKGRRFLIDAGFSGKKLEERLAAINVEMSTIDAILVTHEHIDHVQCAGILSRKHNMPIYITQKSFRSGAKRIGSVSDNNIRYITGDFQLAEGLNISPFEVMHDAELTIGYEINEDGRRAALATDIGYCTNTVREKFRDVNFAIIESNYDYDMLMNGSYPWELKERVKGRNGHLSNVEAGKFIKSIYGDNLQRVFLAHVSQENNTYKKALATVEEYLNENEIKVNIEVALQDTPTKIFEI